MALNKKVLLKIALFFLLLGFTATTVVDARFDPGSFITRLLPNGDANYHVKSTTGACCDKCYCEEGMYVQQCHCADVGETCHSECEYCRCTQSSPPQCQCFDLNDFCYDKCSSSVQAQPN